ncbi:FkbM family methyltransferase [Mucisphaera calidilacus]|uniref:Methyltransferase FkbM domain-containing protein n=1 Tax=Mucisphaera calidilacus TaxID=2527982 RepID=A0A518BTF2_9BACT|nr:FkbM family methyltransferase [Mucisphaera calidilacus]QDU70235.1 hypothetical protein Pan265_00570 [Mucisphaera calidilacus]
MKPIRRLKQFIKNNTPTWVYYQSRRLYRALSPELRREDQREQQFMATLVKPGDLVFDIGCHLGRKAQAFRACGTTVVGIEPEPLCQRMIRYAFRNDPDFTLVPAALADKPGTMTLHVSTNLSMTSLRNDWASTARTVDVDVTTLDLLIERFGRPDYCKIDVEGFETTVLSGLTQPVPLISFEFAQRETQRAIDCLDMLSRLAELRINVTPMDETDFHFPQHLTRDDFVNFITNDWNLGSRGDIYVWSTPEA